MQNRNSLVSRMRLAIARKIAPIESPEITAVPLLPDLPDVVAINPAAEIEADAWEDNAWRDSRLADIFGD